MAVGSIDLSRVNISLAEFQKTTRSGSWLRNSRRNSTSPARKPDGQAYPPKMGG